MADRASGREARGDVVWIGGSVKVLRVARIAICGRAHKYIIDVARRAGYGDVRASQRERRVVVIEYST